LGAGICGVFYESICKNRDDAMLDGCNNEKNQIELQRQKKAE
jgi:hypothetical protein